MTETADHADIAKRRAGSYWLLARLVLERPAAPLLEDLQRAFGAARAADDALATELAALSTAVSDALRGVPPEIELHAEHTRLWGGLSANYGPPPPYESVVREQRLPGDATTSVAIVYAQSGLAPEIDEAGPADHLAVELRYLGLCCAGEADAWRAGDRASARRWVERERTFLDDHLLAWAPAHCRRVSDEARTAYHRAIGTLIAAACELDRDDVEALASAAAGLGDA